MNHESDNSWVRKMLYPGENLLWAGKPGKFRPFRKEDVYLLPFSLIWCGFVVFIAAGLFKQETPLFSKLFLIPFFLVGFYSLIGRFLHAWLREKQSCYALTSQRIIVKSGKDCKTLELIQLPHQSVVVRRDGSGDIRFGESSYYGRFYSDFTRSSWIPKQSAVLELRNVDDVNSVAYRIRSAEDRAILALQRPD